MAEVSIPVEVQKPKLSERLRQAWTVSGAKEAWYKKNVDRITQFNEIRDQLTPDERAQAEAKIEQQAIRSAKTKVGLRWGAVAAGALLAAGAGVAIGKPDLVRNLKIGKLNFGEKLAIPGDKAREVITAIPARAKTMKETISFGAALAKERVQETTKGVFAKVQTGVEQAVKKAELGLHLKPKRAI